MLKLAPSTNGRKNYSEMLLKGRVSLILKRGLKSFSSPKKSSSVGYV
jgi:hypothetical protein